MLLYKEILNRLESESPGTKQAFYWGFLARQKADEQTRPSMAEHDRAVLHPCATCGQPTTGEICSYCKLMARAQKNGSPASAT
jgi:recombinational DNA repair protein RecR